MTPSAISLLSLVILATSPSVPKFVVPDFPDLMIKTRHTTGERHASVDTLYLKGARQRRETVFEFPAPTRFIDITQCDMRRRYTLDEQWKTFDSFPIEDWQQRIKRARPVEISGAEVNVTVDSVDTGERRKFGSLEARHVKTTTKVEPGPGANMEASLREVDSWYIDLPGFGCQESLSAGVLLADFSTAGQPHKQDRIVIKQLGKAPRGIPMEETSRDTQGNLTTISKIELLEFSEAPVDRSLFELPSGYRRALQTPYGGHDMTKPDSLSNRLQAYWQFWSGCVQRWFRSIV